MLEFHGWATLSEAVREADEDPELFKAGFLRIRAELERLDEDFFHARFEHGTSTFATNVWCHGFLKKASYGWDEVVELFKLIAEVTPGSYGLLHFHDAYALDGMQNQFQTYVLKRGTLTLEKDVFLSPVIPTLEDDDS